MFRKILVTLVIIFNASFIGSVRADCVVVNSSESGSKSLNQYLDLIEEWESSGCLYSLDTELDDYDLNITFLLEEMCDYDYSSFCSSLGSSGIPEKESSDVSGASVKLSKITLSSTLSFSVKKDPDNSGERANVLIGNPTDDPSKKYGMPFLDASSYSKKNSDGSYTNVFACDTNFKYGIRNVIIKTDGVVYDDVFDSSVAACIKDVKNVFVCPDRVYGDPRNHIDEAGYDPNDSDDNEDWCLEDRDGDGHDNIDDCDDNNSAVWDDCDGGTTGGEPTTGDTDDDGDGFYNDDNGDGALTDDSGNPVGDILTDEDCDDADATSYPGAYDAPNDGIDQNCNGVDARAGLSIRKKITTGSYHGGSSGGPSSSPADIEKPDGVYPSSFDFEEFEAKIKTITLTKGENGDVKATLTFRDYSRDSTLYIKDGSLPNGVSILAPGGKIYDLPTPSSTTSDSLTKDLTVYLAETSTLVPGEYIIYIQLIRNVVKPDGTKPGSGSGGSTGPSFPGSGSSKPDVSSMKLTEYTGSQTPIDEDYFILKVVDGDIDEDGDGFYVDGDGDGEVTNDDGSHYEDCDDTNPEVAADCDDDGDGYYNDDNGDGIVTDADGNTVPEESTDCLDDPTNSSSASTNPGNTEEGETECNDTLDNDCDTLVDHDDPGCANEPDHDVDDDGHDDVIYGGDDCDDTDAAVNPDVTETGNVLCSNLDEDGVAIDDDCDGLANAADPGCSTTVDHGETDDDGDGYCEDTNGDGSCSDGTLPGDCDDTLDSRAPNNLELCDGVDNDCDGSTSDEEESTYYRDFDEDGFGNGNISLELCISGGETVPDDNEDGVPDYVANRQDCDDTDATKNITCGTDGDLDPFGDMNLQGGALSGACSMQADAGKPYGMATIGFLLLALGLCFLGVRSALEPQTVKTKK